MKRRLLLSSAVALVFLAPASSFAQRTEPEPVRVEPLAEKLGVKLGPSTARELELGQSATMLLMKPEKLATYGIKMHEGARVTVTRVGPGRLRVDADELQPVPKTIVVTMKLADDGTLETVPERTATTAAKPR